MKTIKLALAILGLLSLVACGQSEHEKAVLKVGTVAGPETEIMETVKEVALKQSGFEIEIVTFEDYVLPNTALADGLIDANAMQTEDYFQKMLDATGFDLENAGYTFIYPVGLYSKRYTDIKDLPNGARIAIPNDASNEARGLLLLVQAGLITLNDTPMGAEYAEIDIKDNPRLLEIIPIDAAQTPRMLGDVDAAVINTNYALPAGLLPTRDAIFVEKVNPSYANIIAVKKGHTEDAKIKALVAAYQSDEVIAKTESLFQGQAIPAWEHLKAPL